MAAIMQAITECQEDVEPQFWSGVFFSLHVYKEDTPTPSTLDYLYKLLFWWQKEKQWTPLEKLRLDTAMLPAENCKSQLLVAKAAKWHRRAWQLGLQNHQSLFNCQYQEYCPKNIYLVSRIPYSVYISSVIWIRRGIFQNTLQDISENHAGYFRI